MHSEIIAPEKTARNKRADWAPPQPPNPAPPRGPLIEEVCHTRPSALLLGKRYHGAHRASPRHLSLDACEARAQCMSPCTLDSLCKHLRGHGHTLRIPLPLTLWAEHSAGVVAPHEDRSEDEVSCGELQRGGCGPPLQREPPSSPSRTPFSPLARTWFNLKSIKSFERLGSPS
jgi:hypothetical protein